MVISIDDPPLRRSTRSTRSNPSGSEYSAGGTSSPSSRSHNDRADGDEEDQEQQFTTSQRGRKRPVKSYKEDTSDIDVEDEDDDDAAARPRKTRTSGRNTRLNGFIVSDDEGGEAGKYNTRARTKSVSVVPKHRQPPRERRPLPPKRVTRRSARDRLEEEGYVDGGDGDADADGSLDDDIDPDAPQTSPSPEPDPDEQDNGGKTYSFRKRAPVNYAIPPPLEDLSKDSLGNGRSRGDRGKGRAKPPRWGATGAELSRMMGLPMPHSDSDSDGPAKTPRKTFGAGGVGGGMFANGSAAGVMPGEFGVGTPSNLGKVGESSLADADPLGVNPNVTFDSVGGLDDHISALKEMTLLPLLYPELFQRFNLTPPRGVLFHGPPGTGKTLLARALASSARSGGRSISFFMRKGADVLSKWVGEAERQLRILFEEAKACQPSIIFFDEIDGLAPVRSSRQDQIHASIVATLLALMDGMDGRGQVVVIGATNRPDAVDPALRRPGRFDREFYFPLPNLTARAKILSIITKDWDGWDSDKGEEARLGLAKLTKGYGGADLRALCTEAALNAVQRRYPQIYQSEERLLVTPESVNVEPRDFMISIKKLVPSSARSSSSVAAPLATQFVPLLSDALALVQAALEKAMPVPKKRNALEEAEWEEEGSNENALEREMLLQSMDTLRIYRPRIVLHGPSGMGQGYVGAAALHHLEGFHVQSLDLGNLMSDSSRTIEAAIVQLFLEAKRNQPSVIYIPSLTGWCAALSETARATVRSMLESLAPTDPVLLLAIADCPFTSLPRDVKAWFGMIRENRVPFEAPRAQERSMFFNDLIQLVRKPPTEFPDAVKRKRRVLEKLPVAPPIAPRVPTAAELAQQEQKDEQTIAMLKFRLGPVLIELKKKFKRFSKPAADEYGFDELTGQIGAFRYPIPPSPLPVSQSDVFGAAEPNGIVNGEGCNLPAVNGALNGIHTETTEPPAPARPKMYNIDLERIHAHLYRGKYLTTQDFLDDLAKIVHNATVFPGDNERLVKAQMMYTNAQVHTNEFDSHFRLECERMAARERKRREEWAAANPKPSGPSNRASAQIIRRSARNNGQQPEVLITDPVQLERRLKRQRSSEPSGESQDEIRQVAPRSPKKARVTSEDEDVAVDPLDVVGPTSSQPRPSTVRFAHGLTEQRMASPSPTTHVQEEEEEHGMMVDPPLRPHPHIEVSTFTPPPAIATQTSSARLNHILVLPRDGSTSIPTTPSRFGAAFPPAPPVSPPEPHPSTSTPPTPTAPPEMPLRTPSPSPGPQPTFNVSDHFVHALSEKLTNGTDALTVEQLEQLRAACLGCVWRRRSDWQRDGMAQELLNIVSVFVEEIAENDLSHEE